MVKSRNLPEPKKLKCRPLTKRYNIRKHIFPANITNLPIEILEKIIGYVSKWQRQKLRSTCRLLRFVTDTLTLHEFQKKKNKCNRNNLGSYEFNAMNVIQAATESYIKFGLNTVFLGKLLSMQKIYETNPFGPPTLKVKKFLFTFYKLAREMVGSPLTYNSRVLYILTFLKILNEIPNRKVTSSDEIESNGWIIEYSLIGSWFGVLSARTSHTIQIFEYETNSTEILVLMAILLLIIKEKIRFRVHEGENVLFVLGNEIKNPRNTPTVTVSFDFRGDVKTLEALKLAANQENFCSDDLPTGEFCVQITIKCKEAEKWGCSPIYFMHIGPSAEDVEEDKENEDENNILSNNEIKDLLDNKKHIVKKE